MAEQWIVEAENSARHLAKKFRRQITTEAHYEDLDEEWYFEKVLRYMKEESEESE